MHHGVLQPHTGSDTCHQKMADWNTHLLSHPASPLIRSCDRCLPTSVPSQARGRCTLSLQHTPSLHTAPWHWFRTRSTISLMTDSDPAMDSSKGLWNEWYTHTLPVSLACHDYIYTISLYTAQQIFFKCVYWRVFLWIASSHQHYQTTKLRYVSVEVPRGCEVARILSAATTSDPPHSSDCTHTQHTLHTTGLFTHTFTRSQSL